MLNIYMVIDTMLSLNKLIKEIMKQKSYLIQTSNIERKQNLLKKKNKFACNNSYIRYISYRIKI